MVATSKSALDKVVRMLTVPSTPALPVQDKLAADSNLPHPASFPSKWQTATVTAYGGLECIRMRQGLTRRLPFINPRRFSENAVVTAIQRSWLKLETADEGQQLACVFSRPQVMNIVPHTFPGGRSAVRDQAGYPLDFIVG